MQSGICRDRETNKSVQTDFWDVLCENIEVEINIDRNREKKRETRKEIEIDGDIVDRDRSRQIPINEERGREMKREAER